MATASQANRGVWAQHRGDESSLNPPPRALPIGIAQAALEDLAGILARQVGLDLDGLRHLVVGERDLELRADGRDVERHPRRGSTTAISASPNSASGMPNTAQSFTPGIACSAASISAG